MLPPACALAAHAHDDVARLLLQWGGEVPAPVQLPAEEASFAESVAQADRREFYSDAAYDAIRA